VALRGVQVQPLDECLVGRGAESTAAGPAYKTPAFPDEVSTTVLNWLKTDGEDLSPGKWYDASVHTTKSCLWIKP
jgi:hypothetical protein